MSIQPSARLDRSKDVMSSEIFEDLSAASDAGIVWNSKDELRKAAAQAASSAFKRLAEKDALHVIDDPFASRDLQALPALREDEHDILSDDKLKELCRLIVEDQVSGELAAMGVGIPPVTLVEYLETGCADIASGIPSRKGVAAQAVMAAQYAVIKSTTLAVRTKSLGWQNYQFLLASMFPQHFSEKRMNKKETQQSAALEALQRQLGAAMNAPAALPEMRVKGAVWEK